MFKPGWLVSRFGWIDTDGKCDFATPIVHKQW